MKKHIPLIIVICLLVCLTVLYIINTCRSIKYYDGATDKAIEEFTFDYGEEIATYEIKESKGYNNYTFYVITIYGEKTMATYLYRDGEIWNYENQSN